METRQTGRVFFIHCWLGVWTEPGQWFFYWGSVWGQTRCSVIDKLQLKHAKSYLNKSKKKTLKK